MLFTTLGITLGYIPLLFTTVEITYGSRMGIYSHVFTTLGITWGYFPMLVTTLGIYSLVIHNVVTCENIHMLFQIWE